MADITNKKLKPRGYYVVVLDLYQTQPTYADDYRIVNILGKKKCLSIAKEFHAAAIMSDECDIAIPTIVWISEKLKKPSIGIDMAELYTNKYKMRLFCRDKGFNHPAFYKCGSLSEALNVYKEFGSKMIMEPLDANSSREVFSVKSEKDIVNFFDESLK